MKAYSKYENDPVHLQKFNDGECMRYRVVGPNWTAELSRCPREKAIQISNVLLWYSL